jgi:hypothetical protein
MPSEQACFNGEALAVVYVVYNLGYCQSGVFFNGCRFYFWAWSLFVKLFLGKCNN